MSISDPPPPPSSSPDLLARLRALIVLQLKLWAEATRDVLLSPLLLLLGLAALFREQPFHDWFERVMGLARRSEDFLDVFGRSRAPVAAADARPAPTFDDLIDVVERQVGAQASKLDREAIRRRLQTLIDAAVKARSDGAGGLSH